VDVVFCVKNQLCLKIELAILGDPTLKCGKDVNSWYTRFDRYAFFSLLFPQLRCIAVHKSVKSEHQCRVAVHKTLIHEQQIANMFYKKDL
jgi:hypothetical protein